MPNESRVVLKIIKSTFPAEFYFASLRIALASLA